MSNTSLCPSEIHLLLILEFLISGSRENVFSGQADSNLPFELLCFFQDAIDLPKSPRFRNRQHLVACVAQYIHSEPSLTCKSHFESALVGDRIDCVDSLLDFMDHLQQLFFSDPNAEVNGVCAPTYICASSFLGLYVRSCVARWECMPFDSVGELFEQLLVFRKVSSLENEEYITAEDISSMVIDEDGLDEKDVRVCRNENAFDRDQSCVAADALLYNLGTDESVMDTFTINNSISEAHYHGQFDARQTDPTAFLLNAQKAILSGDSLVAEDSIHRYFDNSKSFLRSTRFSPNNAGILGMTNTILDDPTAASLETLANTVGDPQYVGTRHQTAMLALSTMWVRGGHLQLALRCTEEAMKTAHQRGDHAAVTNALMLLHAITLADSSDGDSNSGMSSRANAEELLERCIVRCATLGLRALSVHATLQLVRLRSRGHISFTQRIDGDIGTSTSGLSNNNSTVSSSVHDLWRLMAAIAGGDIHLAARIAKAPGYGRDVSAITTKVSEASGSDVPLTVAEAIRFASPIAETSMDLWMRLSCPEMAEIVGRRVLHHLGLFASSENLITVGTRISCARVDAAWDALQKQKSMKVRHEGSHMHRVDMVQANAVARVDSALQMIHALQTAFPASRPAFLSDTLHAAKLYVCTHEAMLKGDWTRALRLALRLADATGTSCQSEPSHVHNSTTHIRSGPARLSSDQALSTRNAQSLLLTARVMSFFDCAEATALLARLEADAQKVGLVQYVTLARSQRAQLTAAAAISPSIGNQTSQPIHVSHAKQAWRMDALLLAFNAAKLCRESGSALVADGGVDLADSNHLLEPALIPSFDWELRK